MLLHESQLTVMLLSEMKMMTRTRTRYQFWIDGQGWTPLSFALRLDSLGSYHADVKLELLKIESNNLQNYL